MSASTHLDRSPLVATFAEPIADTNSEPSPVPLFYGWFFNQSIAESISIIGKKYFLTAYDTLPQFEVFINGFMVQHNITNPLEYYVKPLDPDTQLPDLHYHTTAKFCGRNDSSVVKCTKYLSEVSQYLGRPYRIHLVGLFFTKNTYGIRVKLTPEEQKLFQQDDRINSAQAMTDNNDAEETNEITYHISIDTDPKTFPYEPYYYSKYQVDESSHPFYPGIKFRPQKENFHPTESRAHVTLGCAPQVNAVQTGLDLQEIIDMEVSSFVHHQDFTIGGKDVPRATLREFKVHDDFGSTAFVVYPSEEMVAEATFNAYF